jgi:hypothetical protein
VPHNGYRKGNGSRVSVDAQLAVVAEHLARVKDVAIGLGEARGIWTASAAGDLAAYIQEQTDAALTALAQLKPLIRQPEP